jgi:hypothetical protein
MSKAGGLQIVPERDIGRSTLLWTSARKIQASRSRFRPLQEAWTWSPWNHICDASVTGSEICGRSDSDASSRISAPSQYAISARHEGEGFSYGAANLGIAILWIRTACNP